MKSTRNSDNYNHIDGSITPSTILVHGLLGEVCISDNDCSILNSICDNFTKRCSCKKGTVPDALEKVCKVAERVVPPTMLISKYNTHINLEYEILSFFFPKDYLYVLAQLSGLKVKCQQNIIYVIRHVLH